MEKEGLHRIMEFMKGENLKVGVLVTDRHHLINKWPRETRPTVKHYFNDWHVAKGIHDTSLQLSIIIKFCYSAGF